MGGARGAFDRGFELTYWCETISPSMLSTLARLTPASGDTLRVHTIPKLDYFHDAGDLLRPLLAAGVRSRSPLAQDVGSALFAPWSAEVHSPEMRPVLSLSFDRPCDAILITYRRSTVGKNAWDLLDLLARQGELQLLSETAVEGVPLARLYGVTKLVEGRFREDLSQRIWYQLPAAAARQAGLEEGTARARGARINAPLRPTAPPH